MPEPKPLRLGLYQCTPGLPGDVAGNLRRLRHTARRAARKGVDLLVCPEMFATGYNIGAARVAELAEPADGPISLEVAAIARHYNVAVLYGYPERHAEGCAPFNSVQLIDRHGARRANYRKTHLFGDLDHGQFSAPDDPPAPFEFEGFKIGLLICFDVEFPETVRSLALAGAELVLVPTANMRPFEFVAETLVPSRAYENQIFLAYANYHGVEGNLDYCGLSSVVAPDGALLQRGRRTEQLLIADVALERVAAARTQLNYLTERRPDLYRR